MFILKVLIVVWVLRLAYLALTLFLTTDVLIWREGLMPWERWALRRLAELGMDKDELKKVEEMRERIRKGLPPF